MNTADSVRRENAAGDGVPSDSALKNGASQGPGAANGPEPAGDGGKSPEAANGPEPAGDGGKSPEAANGPENPAEAADIGGVPGAAPGGPVPKRRHSRGRTLIIAAAVVVLSVLIAFAGLSAFGDISGLNKPEGSVVVAIPKGATAADVAEILRQKGVIRNKWVFRIYLKRGEPAAFQHGEFKLDTNMDYGSIIGALTDNRNNLAIVSVTIPEGYTVRQIAQLLEDKKVCSADAFIKSGQNDPFQFSYLPKAAEGSGRVYRLEGYLFPDTYRFYKDSDPKTVIGTMLDTFKSRVGGDLAAKAKAQRLTVDQAVTLASIIQAEASDENEMKTVSSVFHNRLKKGTGSLKCLQSDATIFYITRVIQPTLGRTDLVKTSPYNSYRHAGLTPGPIGNPGLAALKAAVGPASTGYFYFVTDSDDTYYYAKTFAQHQRNVAEAEKVGTVAGTDTARQ